MISKRKGFILLLEILQTAKHLERMEVTQQTRYEQQVSGEGSQASKYFVLFGTIVNEIVFIISFLIVHCECLEVLCVDFLSYFTEFNYSKRFICLLVCM